EGGWGRSEAVGVAENGRDRPIPGARHDVDVGEPLGEASFAADHARPPLDRGRASPPQTVRDNGHTGAPAALDSVLTTTGPPRPFGARSPTTWLQRRPPRVPPAASGPVVLCRGLEYAHIREAPKTAGKIRKD